MVEQFLNKKISCTIGGVDNIEGVIVKCNSFYYILNNITRARNNIAKKEYRGIYNYEDDYYIGKGTAKELESNRVSNIKLLEEVYELW